MSPNNLSVGVPGPRRPIFFGNIRWLNAGVGPHAPQCQSWRLPLGGNPAHPCLEEDACPSSGSRQLQDVKIELCRVCGDPYIRITAHKRWVKNRKEGMEESQFDLAERDYHKDEYA
jgi:hypothetical protein